MAKATRKKTQIPTLKLVVIKAEIECIVNALKTTQGHRARAAKLLGISRKNLWEKLIRYKITTATDGRFNNTFLRQS